MSGDGTNYIASDGSREGARGLKKNSIKEEKPAGQAKQPPTSRSLWSEFAT